MTLGTTRQWGTRLACGCHLGYERCFDCRPGLHMDQEAALAITLEKHQTANGENASETKEG